MSVIFLKYQISIMATCSILSHEDDTDVLSESGILMGRSDIEGLILTEIKKANKAQYYVHSSLVYRELNRAHDLSERKIYSVIEMLHKSGIIKTEICDGKESLKIVVAKDIYE